MTFNFDTSPKNESIINHLLGSLIIICVLISTFLNPLVLYSYARKRKTVQNYLFKVIALSDFVTTLIPGVFISYVFLSNINFKYTFKNEIPEFLSCTFGCISQVTTTLMAATRLISIVKPFVRVKFKVVVAYVVFYAVYMALGNAGSLVVAGMKESRNVTNVAKSYDYRDDNMATIQHMNKFVCFVMNMIHCILGVLCSLVAVAYLRIIIGGSPEQARKLKSCYTILIMNAPYILSIISNFMAFFQAVKIDFKLVNHYMIPILTSAFNPCVIVARTNIIKELRDGKSRSSIIKKNSTGTILLSRTTTVRFMSEPGTTPRSEEGQVFELTTRGGCVDPMLKRSTSSQ